MKLRTMETSFKPFQNNINNIINHNSKVTIGNVEMSHFVIKNKQQTKIEQEIAYACNSIGSLRNCIIANQARVFIESFYYQNKMDLFETNWPYLQWIIFLAMIYFLLKTMFSVVFLVAIFCSGKSTELKNQFKIFLFNFNIVIVNVVSIGLYYLVPYFFGIELIESFISSLIVYDFINGVILLALGFLYGLNGIGYLITSLVKLPGFLFKIIK